VSKKERIVLYLIVGLVLLYFIKSAIENSQLTSTAPVSEGAGEIAGTIAGDAFDIAF
jgi:hypothetical protein